MLKPTFGVITKLITNSLIPSTDCTLNMRFILNDSTIIDSYYDSNRITTLSKPAMYSRIIPKYLKTEKIVNYVTVSVVGSFEQCKEVQLICKKYIREQRIYNLSMELLEVQNQSNDLCRDTSDYSLH